MIIGIRPSTRRLIQRHAIGPLADPIKVAKDCVLIDLDREVINALLDRVPVGSSWDEVITAALLQMEARGA